MTDARSVHRGRVAVWRVKLDRGVPFWQMIELGPPRDPDYRGDLPRIPGSSRVFTMADAELVSGLNAPAAWDWVLDHAGEYHAPQA